jgi:rhodanese-related sulfurtransferase
MANEPLSAAALAALLESDAPGAVLDVRERGEFALRQIPGTSPLARGTLEYRAWSVVPSRRLPIVVLDDDGRRAALAAETLRAMAYADVRTLAGGLAAWVAAGRPTREGWGVRGKEYGERVAVDRAVPQVTADELAARRRLGEPLTVIDVRSEEEYLRGHVPDAYHVPGGQLLLDAPPLLGSLDSPVVISCAGRTRGILGAQTLREAGFPNVQALLNGAMGWRLAGFELEMGPGRARPAAPPDVPAWVTERTRRLVAEESIRFLSVDDYRRLRASDEPHYTVDVRLPAEYEAGRIPGATLLPAGQIALHHENFLAVRQATLVVVADDAIRPVWAARLFQHLGFGRVYVLEGGLAAWDAAGESVERGPAAPPVYGLEAARQQVAALTPAELLAARRDCPETMLLDVRASGEYLLGHIPGSRWAARGKLELEIDRLVSDRARPIVEVCDSGVRSTLAAATLRSIGYADARYLAGGLAAWQAAALPQEEGLDGADVTVEEAQADFGHTLWQGAARRSREDMERYLSWEEALSKQPT